MIEISGVRPSVRELRPITREWGGLHWWMCLQLLAPFFGLWTLAMVVIGLEPANDALGGAVATVLLATVFAWLLVRWLVNRATLKAARVAPAGGLLSDWRIDRDGLDFLTRVSSAHIDWTGIKAVRDERDRFVFLVSPQNNPVLPKRQLTEAQLKDLRDLIAEVTMQGRLGRGVD